MRCAVGGPGVFAGTQKPDGVGAEAGGFCGTGDLNGRVVGLGCEERFIERAIKFSEELAPAHAAVIEAEGAAAFDSFLQAALSLELGAGQRAGSGEGKFVQQFWRPLGPIQSA